MKSDSIKTYLKHYGKAKSLRASNLSSTFKRIAAEFDTFGQTSVASAIQAHLGQDPCSNLRCVYCEAQATCWDHLIAAADGGSHQLKNLAPSCRDCNAKKGNNSWQVYLTTQGYDQSHEYWKRLEAYTQGFVPGRTFVSRSEKERLDKILVEIIALLGEADQVIGGALKRRSAGGASIDS